MHGACRGMWLAARRLARCHPWSPMDVDPVPTGRPGVELQHANSTCQPLSCDLARDGESSDAKETVDVWSV